MTNITKASACRVISAEQQAALGRVRLSHDPCNRFREQGFSTVLPELKSLSTMTQHLTWVCRHCMDGGVERNTAEREKG